MKRPLVIVAIGLLVGIIGELYFKKSMLLFIFGILIFKIVLGFFQKNKSLRYLNFFITYQVVLFIVLGMVMGIFLVKNKGKNIENLSKIDESYTLYATVISEVKTTKYKDSYKIKIENDEFKNSKLFLQIKRQDKKFKYGELLILKGRYKKPSEQRNYRGYDYNKYLLSTNVQGIFENTGSIKVLKERNLSFFSMEINKFVDKIKEKVNTFLDGENKELFVSLILADKNNLSEEIQENFRDSNLSHILAVSGMHVTYITVIFMFLINKIINKRYSKIIISFLLVLYMQITSYSPSVVRASVMIIFALLSGVLYRQSDTRNNIAISMLLIFINNPYTIYNLGFQLSYLGTISIILFQKMIGELFNKYLKIKLLKDKDNDGEVYGSNGIKHLWKRLKLKKYITEIIQVAISANILLLPLIIYNFNILPLNFLISNILATPIITVVIFLGIITIIISFFFHRISVICGYFLNIFLNLLNFITKISSKISNKFIGTPPIILLVFYYVIVLMVLYRFNLSKQKYLHCIEKKIISILNKIKCKVVIFLLISIICLNTFVHFLSRGLTVNFVDVGQGDCTLITTYKNKKILIDGGGSEFSDYDVGEKIVVPYLLDRGINCLDYIMISHFDSDHVGGIFAVLEKIKVKNVLVSKQQKESRNYEKFINIIKRKNINVICVKKGDKIIIDKKTQIEILWPDEKNLITDNVLNNNSIVAKLVYQKFKMLLCGDIEKIAEEEILKKKIDISANVIKVAHHGSKSSSIEDFIKKVKPEIALIGVGEDNTFGHPSSSVLDRLRKKDVKIYRTDKNGEIILKIRKDKIKVKKKLKENV